MVRPNSPTVGIALASADRPWNTSLLTGGSLTATDTLITGGSWTTIAMLVLVVLALTLKPNQLPTVSQQPGASQQSTTKIVNVLLVCSTFMFVGPLLMLLNKEVMQTLKFDLPITISCFGLLTTALVVRSCVAMGVLNVRQETLDTLGPGWYRSVLPISLAKAMTLATGNAVYLHLGIGFIQMLKAVTPVIVCLLMFAFSLPLPTKTARWGVLLIISGTLLEVKGETNATMIGLVLMFSSEMCEALSLVLTQKLLHNCKLTLVEGLYMIAPPSGIFLLCAAAVLEGPKFWYESRYRVMIDNPGHFVANCFLGLAVNFVGMALLQATSSLTCKILNTIRGIGVIMFGIVYYSEKCSPLEVCGYAVALVGFALYNFAQYNADQNNSKASQLPLSEQKEEKGSA